MNDAAANANEAEMSAADNPLATARLAFVGCGVMAEAILAGLLRRALVAPAQVAASHPREARRRELREKYGVEVYESNRAAADFTDQQEGTGEGREAATQEGGSLVVLAVKPQRLGSVLEELSGAFSPRQLVVSIVAGARIDAISDALSHRSIVRAMPNTPAQVGAGMTAWTPTEEVSEEQLRQVRAMLGALGSEMFVETENMIDMATALSATGPTYIFMMMEALVDAGVHMGFSRHVAQELVTQTMLGSVLFARESRKHPAELRNMVTSPGGTSAEAIYQMEKGSLRTVLSKAVYAAYQRAVALGARSRQKKD
jgi:pyrroline-5-carboxylate reductase